MPGQQNHALANAANRVEHNQKQADVEKVTEVDNALLKTQQAALKKTLLQAKKANLEAKKANLADLKAAAEASAKVAAALKRKTGVARAAGTSAAGRMAGLLADAIRLCDQKQALVQDTEARINANSAAKADNSAAKAANSAALEAAKADAERAAAAADAQLDAQAGELDAQAERLQADLAEANTELGKHQHGVDLLDTKLKPLANGLAADSCATPAQAPKAPGSMF